MVSNVYRTIIIGSANIELSEEQLKDEHELFNEVRFVGMAVTIETVYVFPYDEAYLNINAFKR